MIKFLGFLHPLATAVLGAIIATRVILHFAERWFG